MSKTKARGFANKMLSDLSQSQKPLITMNHKTLEDVKEMIEKKLTEAKKNKGGGFRQFAPTEKEITIDARIEMKIAVCESLIYELERLKL